MTERIQLAGRTGRPCGSWSWRTRARWPRCSRWRSVRGLGCPDGAGRASGVRAAREFKPDVVVLDVMLPGFDGLEVLARLRADALEVPVLYLSARDAVEDRIAGLTPAPRTTSPSRSAWPRWSPGSAACCAGPGSPPRRPKPAWSWAISCWTRAAGKWSRAGADLTLTATEFEVLRFLMQNPRHVLTKGQILERGLAVRLRRPDQRRRAVHLLPAPQDRGRLPADDPHRPRRGLRSQTRK